MGTKVLKFDGNCYVDCGNEPSFNFGTGSFTLECWFKTDLTDNDSHQMIAKEGYGWTSGYFVRIDDRKLDWAVTGDPGESKTSHGKGNTIVTDGNWHHVALVVDRATGNINVTAYLDGSPDGHSSVSNTGSTDKSRALRIGAAAKSHFFKKGQIAEVRIWNTVRSETEIRTHMNCRLTGKEHGLVGYWRLDEGTGTIAHDLTDNNNDGTIHGAKWEFAGDLTLRPAFIKYFTKFYHDKIYKHPTTVNHEGNVIAFAMDDKQQIYYSVLDMNRSQNGDNPSQWEDVNNWNAKPQLLRFPQEIGQIGYAAAGLEIMPVVKNDLVVNGKLISTAPQDVKEVADEIKKIDKDEDNVFFSTTARLTADAPFQVLSDNNSIYLFRQAIAKNSPRIVTKQNVPIVNNTLLLDRFALVKVKQDESNKDEKPVLMLNTKLDVRYQRSRQKILPASRKDSLGYEDLEKNPFYEPTYELDFVKNLQEGKFSALLIPTAIPDVQRWQIFAYNRVSERMDSYNIERSEDGLFNTKGTQYYTCPDHPEVYERHSGRSPICGKDLVPIINKEGYAETALEFDGKDDYVDVSNINLKDQSFTLAAWAKRERIGVYEFIIAQGKKNKDLGLHFGFRKTNVFTFAFWGNDLDTQASYTDTDWHYWVGTYDADTRERKVYRDGQVVAHKIASDNYRGTGNLIIGMFSNANHFKGQIDEVRIWNTVRTQDQIKENMNFRLIGNEDNLLGYWRFDEGSGNTLYDQTDNTNNGTLHGDPQWVKSDAPIGDHPGISRNTFSFEGRDIKYGPSAILYSQQEEATSGYNTETPKPVKRNARILLATATAANPAVSPEKNYIAALDFGVSREGKLAHVPDNIQLTPINDPHFNPDDIAATYNQIQQLEREIQDLEDEIVPLQRWVDEKDAVTESLHLPDDDNAYLYVGSSVFKLVEDGYIISGDKVYLPRGTPGFTIKSPSSLIVDIEGDYRAGYYHYRGRNFTWSVTGGTRKMSVGVVEGSPPHYCYPFINRIKTRQNTDYENNKVSLESLKSTKRTKEDDLRTKRKKLERLNYEVNLPMPFIHTDPIGLTVSGALLEFAWTDKTPLLFESASGQIRLFFKGLSGQFFVAYYDVNTGKATFKLVTQDMDQNDSGEIRFIARSPEIIGKITVNKRQITTIRVDDDSGNSDLCKVTINRSDENYTETWNKVPRAPARFADVLNGMAKKVCIGVLACEIPQNVSVSKIGIRGKMNQEPLPGETLRCETLRLEKANFTIDREPVQHDGFAFACNPGYVNTTVPFDFTGDFTISFWVKPDLSSAEVGVAGEIGVIGYFDSANSVCKPSISIIRKDESGSDLFDLKYYYNDTTQDKHGNINNFFRINDDWVHVAWVKKGSSFHFYRDGNLFASEPAPANLHGYSNNNFWIGKNGAANNFTGQIDEVRIWGTAREQSEIENDMYFRLTGNESHLQACWTFKHSDISGFAINKFENVILQHITNEDDKKFIKDRYVKVQENQSEKYILVPDLVKEDIARLCNILSPINQCTITVKDCKESSNNSATIENTAKIAAPCPSIKPIWMVDVTSPTPLQNPIAKNQPVDLIPYKYDTDVTSGGVIADMANGSLLFSVDASAAGDTVKNGAAGVESNNTVCQWIAHSPGTSLLFSDTYPSIPSSDPTQDPDINKFAAKDDMTLEVWVKPSSGQNNGARIVNYKSAGNRPYVLGLTGQKSEYHFFAGVDNKFCKTKEFLVAGDSKTLVAGDSWSHLAASYVQSYALRFNGADSYVDCGNNPSLDITGDLTIEAFIQVEDLSQPRGIVTKGKFVEGSHQEVSYSLYVDTDGSLVFAFQDEEGNNEIIRCDKNTIKIEEDTFKKVAVTRKKESKYIEGTGMDQWMDIHFYSNGKTWYKKSLKADSGRNNQSLEIGNAYQANSEPIYFKGIISELRIWNIARAARDIDSPIHGNEDGLVSWWKFEETEGTICDDSVSTNDGTIHEAEIVHSPDSEASELTLYVNGQNVPTTSITESDKPFKKPYGDDQFSLGCYKDSNVEEEKLSGYMDEIRIWKMARTQEQIEDNLFRKLTSDYDRLIAYYDCNSTNQDKLADKSGRGLDLTFKKGNFKFSDVPVSNDSPLVRSALTGIETDFSGAISTTPAIQEYGDMQRDLNGNLTSIMKRCYTYIRDGIWFLVTGYKVGDLVLEWLGQAQFDPEVIGFIEGAPPVPSENLTGSQTSSGPTSIFSNYYGASSIELAEAENTINTYSISKERGIDLLLDFKLGAGLGSSTLLITAPLGIGTATSLEDTNIKIGFHGTFEYSHNWFDDRSISFGKTTEKISSMELHGTWENKNDITYNDIGRRFIPINVGMALVKSETADIFALRLKHNNAMVAMMMRPNPDIPKDWNIITFPINPQYTKQGTLDGKVGFHRDESYRAIQPGSNDRSYFKPKEAYQLKQKIEKEHSRLITDFKEWGYGEFGPDMPTKEKLRRNMFNTYVWTADGGLFCETQETSDIFQETEGANYSLKGMGGLFVEWDVEFAKARFVGDLDLLFGGHYTFNRMTTSETEDSFSLNVDLSGVEGDIHQRDPKGDIVWDYSDQNFPKPQKQAGKVDAYRFMSFFLAPDKGNFKEFKNKIIDQVWLRESLDPNAVALREALEQENGTPWRIFHRVTYVSRVLPVFGEEDEGLSLIEEKLMASGAISNYELIKRIEPYVMSKIDDYGEFCKAVRETVRKYMPEFADADSIEYIVRYMCLYFQVFPETE